MSTFIDADGREWRLFLTVNELRRLRQECGVDLADAGPPLFEQLADPVQLVDVLHCLCGDECRKRDIDAVEFARAMRGDTLDAASTALVEAIIDFFPQRRREVLTTLREKSDALADLVMTRTLDLLQSDKLDQVVMADLDQAERDIDERLSGARSTSGPESSASTPVF